MIERWIQSCRHELLDRTLVWNQAHLLPALREYEQFHNEHRPHRGLANARPLHPLPDPITDHRSRNSESAAVIGSVESSTNTSMPLELLG